MSLSPEGAQTGILAVGMQWVGKERTMLSGRARAGSILLSGRSPLVREGRVPRSGPSARTSGRMRLYSSSGVPTSPTSEGRAAPAVQVKKGSGMSTPSSLAMSRHSRFCGHRQRLLHIWCYKHGHPCRYKHGHHCCRLQVVVMRVQKEWKHRDCILPERLPSQTGCWSACWSGTGTARGNCPSASGNRHLHTRNLASLGMILFLARR